MARQPVPIETTSTWEDHSIATSGQSTLVVVSLPTQTEPGYEQKVVGQVSPYASDVEEFKGIPYGRVSRRWEHSTVRTKLPSDVFDATKHGPRCPQPSAPNTTEPFQSHLEFPQDVGESEFDCLNLIISRPTTEKGKGRREVVGQSLLPVYVYIHGGAFAFGAASDPIWNPSRLIARSIKAGQPIIVVRINYRLNIFGFLASSRLSSSSGCNFGFFDQVTALQWIKANIAAFGGDPNKMTLGGQSAGGTSVYIHALQALCTDSEPSLRSCIIQSPAAGLCGPFAMHTADSRWNVLCQYLELSGKSTDECLERLRSITEKALLAVVADLGWGIFTLIDEASLIHGLADQTNTQVTALNRSRMAGTIGSSSNQRHPLSILSSITSYEASIFIENINLIQSYQHLLTLLADVPDRARILQVYEIKPDISTGDLHHGLYRLLTEVLFTIPAQHGFRDFAKRDARRSVYLRNYIFETGNPFTGPFYKRANHCVDLIYAFDCFHDDLRRVDQEEADCVNTRGVDGNQRSARTNAEMVDDLQMRFIDFVYYDPPQEDPKLGVKNVETILYDQGRRSRIIDTTVDTRFADDQTRYDAVLESWAIAEAIVSAVIGRTK